MNMFETKFTPYIDPIAIVAEKQQFLEPKDEMSLIACILRDPSILPAVRQTIQPCNFQIWGDAYKVLLAMADEAIRLGLPVSYDQMSIITAEDRLGLRLITDRRDTLFILAERSCEHTWRFYASGMIEASAKKWVYELGRDMQTQTVGSTAADILGRAHSRLGQAMGRIAARGAKSSLARAARETMDDPLAAKRWHPQTRLRSWFDTLGGVRAGSVTLLSARSKVGKSLIVANVILGFAEQGVPVLWLDTEMTIHEQGERLLSIVSGVTPDQLRNPANHSLIEVAQAKLEAMDLNMHFHNINDFNHALQLIYGFAASTGGTGIVIFDWLRPDHNYGGPGMQEWQRLGLQMTALKDAAMTCKIPVIVMNQENRAAIGADNKARMGGGEAFVSGADRLVHLASTVCSLRRLSPDMFADMASAIPGIVLPSHVLMIDANRHGQSVVAIPLKLDGLRLDDVTDSRVVDFVAVHYNIRICGLR